MITNVLPIIIIIISIISIIIIKMNIVQKYTKNEK